MQFAILAMSVWWNKNFASSELSLKLNWEAENKAKDSNKLFSSQIYSHSLQSLYNTKNWYFDLHLSLSYVLLIT